MCKKMRFPTSGMGIDKNVFLQNGKEHPKVMTERECFHMFLYIVLEKNPANYAVILEQKEN